MRYKRQASISRKKTFLSSSFCNAHKKGLLGEIENLLLSLNLKPRESPSYDLYYLPEKKKYYCISYSVFCFKSLVNFLAGKIVKLVH